jgi:hypothetical protein
MEADPTRLVHHNGYNVAAMSFDPDMIYHAIKVHKPNFEMVYDVDPLKQQIAESWPDMMDDSCAREEWDWHHEYNLLKFLVRTHILNCTVVVYLDILRLPVCLEELRYESGARQLENAL